MATLQCLYGSREGVQFMFECVSGLRIVDINGCIVADDMGEPGVADDAINTTRTYRQLFHPEHSLFQARKMLLITFPGAITQGLGLISLTVFSWEGGTGSGLGSLLLERLSVDYGKKSKL
ncbi:protein chromatin remodeling 25, partial [Tanacetum coccineum]